MGNDQGVKFIKYLHLLIITVEGLFNLCTQMLIPLITADKPNAGEEPSGIGIDDENRTVKGIEHHVIGSFRAHTFDQEQSMA
jgi:hypothetical protein